MGTCEFLGTFRPFMLQTTLGSLWQDQLFFQAPVLAQTPDGWPGFWQKASLGPEVMAEQRPQPCEPTTTKDAHEPPPRRSVGWLPPSVPPSGTCLMRATRGPLGFITPPRVTPNRGGVSAEGRENLGALWRQSAAVCMPAGSQLCAWPWPPERPAMPGQWRPRRAWHCYLGPSGGATVGSAGPGPSRGWPGARWGACPGAVGDDAGLWPATGRPRPLRPRHVGPGDSPSWADCPADAAPHGHMPRACARDHACAVWGYRSASGRPVRPPSSPPQGPGHRARPGGPRRQARSARSAPARGVRVPDGPDVQAGQGRSGRLPARPCAARGWPAHHAAPAGSLCREAVLVPGSAPARHSRSAYPSEVIMSRQLGRLLSWHYPEEVGMRTPGEQEADPSRRGGPAPHQVMGRASQSTGKKCLCILDDCIIIGVRCTLAPGVEPGA